MRAAKLTPEKCCVIIPFRDRTDLLYKNLIALLQDLPKKALIVLIDDGSEAPLELNQKFKELLSHSAVKLMSHDINLGPAAARNTAINWCRETDLELVILLDSDCVIRPGFVEKHIELHNRFPEFACIGGAIQGEGDTGAARIDAIMSWFTSIPNTPEREVLEPFHLPTTNMSIKLKYINDRPEVFDPRLKTGEDVAFVKSLRNAGGMVRFSPEPCITHRDREKLSGFLHHQWRWGLHTYAVRFGYYPPRIISRALFSIIFAPFLPLFAIYASALNIYPWVRKDLKYVVYWPVVMIVFCFKGIGVLAGALYPSLALYNSLKKQESFANPKLKQKHLNSTHS